MSLEKKLKVLEKEFATATEDYLNANKALDAYRGVELSDETVVEVNTILADIQDRYSAMYPVINFILQNYQQAALSLKNYNQFIDDIKTAGAKEQDPMSGIKRQPGTRREIN
jgi:hypothetical protein